MTHTATDAAGHTVHGKGFLTHANREAWTERRRGVRVLLERHR